MQLFMIQTTHFIKIPQLFINGKQKKLSHSGRLPVYLKHFPIIIIIYIHLRQQIVCLAEAI